jgi:DNA repair ATPase RecN
MSTAPILDRKAAELRLINVRETGTVYRGLETPEGSESSNGELLEHTVEAVVQVAGELARMTAHQNKMAGTSQELSEAVYSLKLVQTALHETGQCLHARDESLAKSIERMERFVQVVEKRHHEMQSETQSQIRCMTTLTLWNVFLSAAAISGLGACLFFFLTRS